PSIHVSHDKAEALKRLESAHLEIRNAIGIGDWPLLTAQQIHGDKIACVNAMVETDREFSGCDGIITNQRGVTLGIYVADCCAVCTACNLEAYYSYRAEKGRTGRMLALLGLANS